MTTISPANGFRRMSSQHLNSNDTSMKGEELVEASFDEPNIAKYLKHYELGETLGVGAHGEVRKAVHKISQQPVAIKFIPRRDMVGNGEKLTEVTALRKIQHPHVVRLFDAIYTTDQVLLVLECLEGGELFDYLIHRHRLSEPEARKFSRQIMSALTYCHNQGIVHRDLKLENLLLDTDDNIKITDFGFSNVYRADGLMSTFVGSPAYAAPEIMANERYSGPKADIWSLGIIIYTLLSGELPFQEDNIVTKLQRIAKADFDMPAHLSADAQHLLQWMLQRVPDDRPSMEELWEHPWISNKGQEMPLVRSQSLPTSSLIEQCFERLGKECPTLDLERLKEDLMVDNMTRDTASYHLVLARIQSESKEEEKNSEIQRMIANLRSFAPKGAASRSQQPPMLFLRPAPNSPQPPAKDEGEDEHVTENQGVVAAKRFANTHDDSRTHVNVNSGDNTDLSETDCDFDVARETSSGDVFSTHSNEGAQEDMHNAGPSAPAPRTNGLSERAGVTSAAQRLVAAHQPMKRFSSTPIRENINDLRQQRASRVSASDSDFHSQSTSTSSASSVATQALLGIGNGQSSQALPAKQSSLRSGVARNSSRRESISRLRRAAATARTNPHASVRRRRRVSQLAETVTTTLESDDSLTSLSSLIPSRTMSRSTTGWDDDSNNGIQRPSWQRSLTTDGPSVQLRDDHRSSTGSLHDGISSSSSSRKSSASRATASICQFEAVTLQQSVRMTCLDGQEPREVEASTERVVKLRRASRSYSSYRRKRPSTLVTTNSARLVTESAQPIMQSSEAVAQMSLDERRASHLPRSQLSSETSATNLLAVRFGRNSSQCSSGFGLFSRGGSRTENRLSRASTPDRSNRVSYTSTPFDDTLQLPSIIEADAFQSTSLRRCSTTGSFDADGSDDEQSSDALPERRASGLSSGQGSAPILSLRTTSDAMLTENPDESGILADRRDIMSDDEDEGEDSSCAHLKRDGYEPAKRTPAARDACKQRSSGEPAKVAVLERVAISRQAAVEESSDLPLRVAVLSQNVASRPASRERSRTVSSPRTSLAWRLPTIPSTVAVDVDETSSTATAEAQASLNASTDGWGQRTARSSSISESSLLSTIGRVRRESLKTSKTMDGTESDDDFLQTSLLAPNPSHSLNEATLRRCAQNNNGSLLAGNDAGEHDMDALDLAFASNARSFGAATTSTKPAHLIISSLKKTLRKMNIEFKELSPVKLQCSYNPLTSQPLLSQSCDGASPALGFHAKRRSSLMQSENVVWEMDVKTLPHLDMRGIRLKRHTGNHWEYKKIVDDVIKRAKL